MNPAEWLQRTAARVPGNPALLAGETVIADYASFHMQAAGVAGALRSGHGIEPGDRIAIFAKNSTDYLIALYGIWFAGACAVPINAKLHAREAAWIIENAAVRIAFSSDGLGEELRGTCANCEIVDLGGQAFAAMMLSEPLTAPHPTGAGDMIWLFYTSGTTGKPKGVMLTSANLTTMALCYMADVDPVAEEDAILYAAPMSHGAGIYNFMHVMTGARHVVPVSGGFDPAEVLTLSARLRNVSMFAAPTMVRRLVDAARAAGSNGDGIKTVVYGGGPMYTADIVEAVDAMGPRFVQIYGQGECPMCITALTRAEVADRDNPKWRERLSSVGRAQSPVRIRIAGEDRRELPPGEIGEITVQGLPVMAGYWKNEAASAETLRGGWLHTGDMGSLDADGYLTLRDRSKDVIISGGTNIYPREIEEVLLTHPSVREVTVVGRQNAEWGEDVVAFVVPAGNAAPDEVELDRHCLDNIARFKRPKAYFFETELPKNNYGKVLKTVLRERLSTGESA
jgi:acyl-CoA synthetase (AMP-forming)/AMP-acid ligase II